jgi:glycogen operon protein
MRCAIVDLSTCDWEGDAPQTADSPIGHLRNARRRFTRSPGARCHPAFTGLIERSRISSIGDYGRQLLPVFGFDDTEATLGPPDFRCNYWGYSTVAFFSPHALRWRAAIARTSTRFATRSGPAPRRHRVILDVVFNHTDEGSHQGPTHSFKGIDNRTLSLDPNNLALCNFTESATRSMRTTRFRRS